MHDRQLSGNLISILKKKLSYWLQILNKGQKRVFNYDIILSLLNNDG